MRQFTKISQMIRIHFDAHHSGLGTGCDVAQTITLVSTLALEIIDRRRTGPLERAALFFVALVMHRPDLLALRTLAVQIAMFGSKHSVKLVFIQATGGNPKLIRVQVFILPQVAIGNDRQDIRLEQPLS